MQMCIWLDRLTKVFIWISKVVQSSKKYNNPIYLLYENFQLFLKVDFIKVEFFYSNLLQFTGCWSPIWLQFHIAFSSFK